MVAAEKFVTARDLAMSWKITHAGVLGLVHDGRLRAIKIGNAYRIYADSVEAYERDNLVGSGQ
jgi:excisionase family DNA binding protein